MRYLQLLVVLAAFLIGWAASPLLPQTIATHWGLDGSADDFSNKTTFLYLYPTFMFVLFLVFQFIPSVDPLSRNIQKFRPDYDRFALVMQLFLLYLFAGAIVVNLGYVGSMIHFVFPGLAVLFFYLGSFLERTKQSWFIGIRTPWTLSSPQVWADTHKQASMLFKMLAVAVLFGLILPQQVAFFLFFSLLLLIVFYLFLFSYFRFEQIKRPKKKKR